MKRPRLRARDRRALILGLIAIAPVATYRAAVEPWLAYRNGLHDMLVAERDLLARERASIRDAEGRPARAAQVERTLTEAEPWLLAGANPVAASGRLTRIVTDAARSAGILVQEVQAADPGSRDRELRQVSASVRVLGDLEGLARLLHGLENAEPLLHVESLSLRAAGMNDGDLQRGQLMNGAMVLVGYWQPPVGVDASRVEAEQ